MKRLTNPSAAIAALTVSAFAGGLSRNVIGPLVPQITTDFAVTNSTIGVVLSGMWFGFAGSQFVGGVLTDKIGERNTVLLANLVMGGATVLMLLSPLFAAFTFGALLLGLGAGTLLVSSQVYIGNKFDDKGGKIGVVTMGASISGLVAPVVGVRLTDLYGWRSALLMGITMATLAILFVYFTITDSDITRESTNSITSQESTRLSNMSAGIRLMLGGQVPTFILIASILYFVFQSMASFFPTLLINVTSVTQETASAGLSVFFLLVAVMNVVLGKVSDQVNKDLILSTCVLTATLGFLSILFFERRVLLFVAVLFIGAGFGWGSTLASRLIDLFSQANRGTGYGTANTIANLIGSAGSAVSSIVATRYTWEGTLWLWVGLLLLGLVVLGANSIYSALMG